VVAKVWYGEINLGKLNDVEEKEQYRVKISNRLELWKMWMSIGLRKVLERI
jgi:hypothetical protein